MAASSCAASSGALPHFQLTRIVLRSILSRLPGRIHDQMASAPIALDEAPTAVAIDGVPRVGEFLTVDTHAWDQPKMRRYEMVGQVD